MCTPMMQLTVFLRYKIDFFPSKNPQNLRDLFWKGKIHIKAKFHTTVLVICSHSRDKKPYLTAE